MTWKPSLLDGGWWQGKVGVPERVGNAQAGQRVKRTGPSLGVKLVVALR